eukprot:Phypoly_transcript_13809.p1 GENE.Phypoly_transcript_13809~~Phypoly_transcript_13809.p1  ORF type:complete len:234 (+),score=28.38 Phypoly_transcript_13809:173-874(+)
MEDTPLVPNKKRLILTKSVLIAVSVSCLLLVAIVGAVVLSHSNAPNANTKQQDDEDTMKEDNFPVLDDFPSYTIPCTEKGTPEGCDDTRIRTVECGTINSAYEFTTVTINDTTPCNLAQIRLHDTLHIQFYKIPGTNNCLEMTARIGECWGLNPINKDTYSCQGQCGPGCVTGCGGLNGGTWASSCFRHDICSWYFGSTGGLLDSKCGTAFAQASSDFFKCDQCDKVDFMCPI